MAEPTSDPTGAKAQLTDALRRHRGLLTGALGICAAALIGALAIPVGLPDAATANARGILGDSLAVAPAEDLSAFAHSDRWGGLTYEELEAQRRAAEAGANADAANRDRMGFVGTTATPDDRVVLLTLPGGEVARIPAGGTLPDGRKVSDVTDTTAILSDPGGEEELELFPRPPEGIVGEALVPARPVGEGLVPSLPDPTPEP